MIPPLATRLPDGRRLHLQHGPMDVIIEVDGSRDAVAAAETAAVARFETILAELVPQLATLRAPVDASTRVSGTVARRMVAAARPFAASTFATPMIAVAGSVADELRHHIAAVPGVLQAYVNNGGDVALHVTAGRVVRVGLMPSDRVADPDTMLPVTADSPVRGLATSGWGGRSFSLGIADAATVVATCTAVADAAATLIANAVDLPGHAAITRARATDLDPDSDLGDQFVTTEVGPLSDRDVDAALERGVSAARRIVADHPDVLGAVLGLRGQRRIVGETLVAVGPDPQELVHATR
ncbi:UPF0280 family protein [Nitriliruptor alkaliphilus]|uniref:UPF0280 family protein n=1 Tax=Nitriliruptor alkaliphilus TaxID=427918 RepID=UPI0006977F4F|nr:UPF0280 family protein [Nitriliruptor alkaliphilus]